MPVTFDYLSATVARAAKLGLALLVDIPQEQMLERPAGLLPPTWLLGHLNLYYVDVLTILRDEPFIDDTKDHPLFSPGTQPLTDPSIYPPKQKLVDAFAQGHEEILTALIHANPKLLNRPTLARSLPTAGAFLLHLMIDHEWYHLGQLAAWRRAMGLPRIRSL